MFIKVKGDWKYLYRAANKQSETVVFLLTAQRDKAGDLHFFEKTIKASGIPEKVTIDNSGANKAVMDEINAAGQTPTIVRQIKNLNNILDVDPSGHQTRHQVYAPPQVISSCQKCPSRHRTHAHDP